MKKLPPKAPGGKTLCLGLMGGVASGKSSVARELERCGARIVDADRLAHEALELPRIAAAVREKLGAEISLPDGSLDRKKIAARVFADAALRRWIESLIHPEVRKKMEAEIERARREEAPLLVFDVPLLAETGLIGLCDRTLFVEAPADARAARAQRDRGWDREEIARREKNQADLAEKRRLADHVIENSGSLEDLGKKVRVWLDSLWPQP